MSRKRLVVAVTMGALALPASASAATNVFAGSAGEDPTGQSRIAMDVVANKKGKPKLITELRGINLPSNCEISGDLVQGARFGVALKVNRKGKFFGELPQETYGNVSSIRGKFTSKRQAKGTFVLDRHYLADATYPEENCTTGPLAFKMTKNAPDVVYPPVAGRH